jgi:hypothetical protein
MQKFKEFLNELDKHPANLLKGRHEEKELDEDDKEDKEEQAFRNYQADEILRRHVWLNQSLPAQKRRGRKSTLSAISKNASLSA